jgi:hypothetical protein
MMSIVTSPTLLEDLSQLDPLLATEGWNTLMTFTRESGCMFSVSCCVCFLIPSSGWAYIILEGRRHPAGRFRPDSSPRSCRRIQRRDQDLPSLYIRERARR